MGHTSYSVDNRTVRADSLGYFTMDTAEIFTQKEINNAMNPHGIQFRESRDSEAHPNSVAIILGLDVTGSMGSVPHHLVKHGLPNIMDGIIQKGIPDPQILFVAVGDHECDRSPLQVGQFESGDEELDKWLTDVYLEGGGGGNAGESYMLAWYFAAYHTQIDCWEKRKKKGFLFTIGDEPVLSKLPRKKVEGIMGPGQYDDFDSAILLDKAREMYDVYHLHIKQTFSGMRQHVIDGWKQLMSDNLIVVDDKTDVDKIISDIVTKSLPITTKSVNKKTIETEEML